MLGTCHASGVHKIILGSTGTIWDGFGGQRKKGRSELVKKDESWSATEVLWDNFWKFEGCLGSY